MSFQSKSDESLFSKLILLDTIRRNTVLRLAINKDKNPNSKGLRYYLKYFSIIDIIEVSYFHLEQEYLMSFFEISVMAGRVL